MRNVLILLMAAFLVAACNNKKASSSETKTENETKTGDTAKVSTTDDNTALPPSDFKPSDGDDEAKWSESDQNRFMYSCQSSATPKVGAERAHEYCDCMLKKLEKNFSGYAEADRELTIDTARMNRMVYECNNGQ